ncbi:DUF748 domain-containing protein [Uliginosibacterium sp. H1]|uniref:DUF748 domain-containing protein n=1 Tax=Uliginosibacterium sp. H1 TaxID=3114757 RepID=UPI002E19B76D|nr:DUF748 domain-containing protein [Uliginosibacterium sp. H1]
MNRRLRLGLLIAVPLLVVAVCGGYYAALHLLRAQIVAALGQTGEVGEIRVGLARIEIDGLRIRASQRGWPTQDELHAARVFVTPDLRSLLGGRIVVSRIEIEDAALTVLRNRAGMQIVPALLDKPKQPAAGKPAGPDAPAGSGPQVRIGHIALRDSRVDFYDATLGGKAQHIPLDELALDLTDLVLPAFDARSQLDVRARVGGQGRLALDGWLVAGTLDSDLQLKLTDTPLKLVGPYLFRKPYGDVKAGTLALDVRSRIDKRRLHAPGHMQLSGLELGGVAGFTREAAAVFARSRGLDADTKRPVALDFTVQGNLDDSRFSLNEAIYGQAGKALVQLVGLGGGSSDGTSSGTGIGSQIEDAVGKLFGK